MFVEMRLFFAQKDQQSPLLFQLDIIHTEKELHRLNARKVFTAYKESVTLARQAGLVIKPGFLQLYAQESALQDTSAQRAQ